ncbi:alpha/beta hydrolase [Mucilaginibacter sp. UR6-1]|uniref:alpha/beta fold hydrolase n=1 Tax=Mucilaginibacter sp. UR6-1 TaxID=1435643 RepID=UPI001E53EC0B|nr:alpha/beta hydrolase [Mucilaginibacter sp. UR6-1]MCC8407815.1 alpha/beta hydrolase [Mucilaginibacter sp. UR6-1]
MNNLTNTSAVSRKEFIEVAPDVRLHVTVTGEGKPLLLIHGWPLSDAMYEYQHGRTKFDHDRGKLLFIKPRQTVTFYN